MNWTKRILIAVLLSVVIAFGLSLLPYMEPGGQGTFKPAFLNKAEALNDQNVVDFLMKMQLHLRIRKVDLNRSIVSIDLSSHAAAEKLDILQDLYTIPQTVFANTTNISQVFIRVLDTNAGSDRSSSVSLLAALDAKRENWSARASRTAPAGADELEQHIQSHSDITFTNKWNARFAE